MIENLVKFIDTLKVQSRLHSYNEDQTKMAIILPILRRLGWDVENIDEVTPEFSVENKRVDYALCLKHKSAVFLEAKKTSEDLESQDHQEQLLEYSYRQGVRLAVLSNGITWALYLSNAEVDWKSRKFHTIDIVEQDSTEAASKFVDLLSKTNVESGKALQNAESLHTGRLKKQAVQSTLPEAWNRIVGEPDATLVELLSERTERICSYKPDLTDVSKFLKSNQGQFLLLPADEKPARGHLPRPSRRGQTLLQEPANDQRISQDELIPHIIRILKEHGGRCAKEQVEKQIHRMFDKIFDHSWYQELVSNGIPRWQHNVAWAKERAKKRGLIKQPSESGRGIWELTDKGMKF